MGHGKVDSRLKRAYELIDSGRVSVLSIDIFDTLLWRGVPHPEDLFLLLGRRLIKEGWLIPAVIPESFVHLRIEAEKKARHMKAIPPQVSEVTLPEIYWQLQPIFVQLSIEQMLKGGFRGVYPGEVAHLVSMELALEKELIHHDCSIVDLIHYAEQKSIPVVLVSDTYFEEKSVRCLLGDVPYIQHFFLSCEYGCSKQCGLFHQVLKTLNIPAARILHIGDHERSDVYAASAAGIQTVHFTKCEKEFEEILKGEWKTDLSARLQLLDEKRGDFGLSSLRTKIAYHPDVDSLKSQDQFYWKYGAQVLGPILLSFVHWIYERCRSLGQPNVFCLMREGKLYSELIRRFAPNYPEHTLTATPLWVSRVFIAHASMESAGKRELRAFMKTLMEEVSIGTFWSYLGLDPQNMGKWSAHKHMMLEDFTLRDRFIEDLCEHPTLRKQIVDYATAKRKRFLKYLSGLTDLASQDQMTLVDVGWAGSTQVAMQNILKWGGSSISLHGLYLGITDKRQEGVLEGIVREGFLFRGGYPHFPHRKGCFVLEQTATAATGVGPLEDIDEEGEIVTHPLWISSQQKSQAEMVQKGIFAYFDHVGSYIQSGSVVLNAHSEALHNQLRAILIRSMTNASQKEAVKLGSWSHEHAPVRHLTQTIGKNRYYEDYIKDMVPLAAFKENDLNWLSAYTAKQSKYLTLAAQAVWLEAVPPQCFLSEDHYPFHVYLDTGRDFPQQAQAQVALRSNPNRHFYTLVKLFSKKPVQRVLLKLAFPASLVRVKSLRMMIYDRSSSEPERVIFFEKGTDASGLECVAGQRLDSNTFYSDGNLQFKYALLPSQVYHIKLKLCCEMFNTVKRS